MASVSLFRDAVIFYKRFISLWRLSNNVGGVGGLWYFHLRDGRSNLSDVFCQRQRKRTIIHRVWWSSLGAKTLKVKLVILELMDRTGGSENDAFHRRSHTLHISLLQIYRCSHMTRWSMHHHQLYKTPSVFRLSHAYTGLWYIYFIFMNFPQGRKIFRLQFVFWQSVGNVSSIPAVRQWLAYLAAVTYGSSKGHVSWWARLMSS